MHPAKTPFPAVRALARPLRGDAADCDASIDMADDADVVLLGESTHGTDEFYRMRAQITARRIGECGFDTMAIEGDWPDVRRVNRCVQGDAAIADADAALSDLTRLPAWMRRNRPMREFVGWLRERDAALPRQSRSGVDGLDLYGLYRCADAVIRYLDGVDPEQAELARQRYAALDHVREPGAYGHAVAAGARPTATAGVLAQRLQLREREAAYLAHDGVRALDARFFAEHNAQVVVNVQAYCRAMLGARANPWNLRDAHTRDTLFALRRHRVRGGGAGRALVWAHNPHVGDARDREASARRMDARPARARGARRTRAVDRLHRVYGARVGRVALRRRRRAQMDAPGAVRRLRTPVSCDAARPLPLREIAAPALHDARLERSIGVIYPPETERDSHYFMSSITGQFDALFHLDETNPLEPLAPPGARQPRETPVSAP
ncbi:protein-L-isoaspartate O-methyltransferase [Burkholderia pseudomallei]|nr:protein-L-isoaspartate O-methyltransferase [Burkholderia pseudomallei]CAJ7844534.1 protein-L-isoaspartate O-methyltransferase [Burkholderia pseudomallei]CAJ8326271.1 protein-L-isoaspartate O-methyltransferase [Burkholderia pseudomallei]CAJ9438190.1 protein-L-isoaspartate O-methyltransferase [Burkholderia pseudomallei]